MPPSTGAQAPRPRLPRRTKPPPAAEPHAAVSGARRPTGGPYSSCRSATLRPVKRIALICSAFACAFPAAASAAGTVLFPGVTYSHTRQWTAQGPVSMHVVTAPRPGGLYALQPVLSNATILRRETVSSMQRRVASSTTAVGINGDFFTWNEGIPTGLLVQNGVLTHHSHPLRSSVGVDATGTLQVARVTTSGFWRGLGAAHQIHQLNERPAEGHVALFTPAWGEHTPLGAATTEVVLESFPPTRAATDLVG